MITVDLSTLSAPELKRLLENARARQRVGLERQLIAELDAQRTRTSRWSDGSEPMAYAPTLQAPSRLGRSGRRRSLGVGAVAASAAVILGWGLSIPSRPRPESAATISTPRVAMALTPARASGSAAESPQLAELKPMEREVRSATPAARKANPCLDEPIPADRLVCGYPTLAAQDRQLREAYDRAVAAGADPVGLTAAQADWLSRRDPVIDRAALATLYADRIRELGIAAQAQRGDDPPPQ